MVQKKMLTVKKAKEMFGLLAAFPYLCH